MNKIAYGYGSEWHLLRYLGYHRKALDKAVLEAVGGQAVEWLDFPFGPSQARPDAEWQGVDFLPTDSPARKVWLQFWPQTGNVPNWDAVGRVEINGCREWLLVEAKAHLDEVKSSCQANARGGLRKIEAAFRETKAAMGVDASANWLAPYYQHANRLAVLYFLTTEKVAARLLFVYFLGDRFPRRTQRKCPSKPADWNAVLRPMYNHLGLTGKSDVEKRVRSIFLHVRPPKCATPS